MARNGSIEKENKMAYKLVGEMVTGAVNASVIPTLAGGGATLMRISVSSAQDVILTRGGQIIGRVHLAANESIELTKEATDTIDIAGDAFVTPIAYHW